MTFLFYKLYGFKNLLASKVCKKISKKMKNCNATFFVVSSRFYWFWKNVKIWNNLFKIIFILPLKLETFQILIKFKPSTISIVIINWRQNLSSMQQRQSNFEKFTFHIKARFSRVMCCFNPNHGHACRNRKSSKQSFSWFGKGHNFLVIAAKGVVRENWATIWNSDSGYGKLEHVRLLFLIANIRSALVDCHGVFNHLQAYL